jgi:hypothetical protein
MEVVMFLRTKAVGRRTYLQIVESYREAGKIKQRLLFNLGRLDQLQQSGKIDGLMLSLQRFSPKLAVLGAAGKHEAQVSSTRCIGAPLLFSRLWHKIGIGDIISELAQRRKFQFPLDRAIFVTVLQRLVKPGSDRAAERWLSRYQIEGVEELDLQHFYRAMAWLGEPLPEEDQDGASPFSPRCVKDLIEEELFARRRNLFSDLNLVFFDTTSIYFEGEGGETLGQRGHSKDHRPDLKQVVVGMVLDNEGYPLCAEIWPGNTADVSTLLPVADRLKRRFHIGNICIVADRGMVSRETKNKLEAMNWQYLLGARMRRENEVRDHVLADDKLFMEVTSERQKSKDPSPLKVKDVFVEGRRYVVCKNEEEARKDRHDREAIIEALTKALKHGDKSLVGNKGYRRYLAGSKDSFSIDQKKIEEDERYDGKWVLTTNLDLPAPEVALKYKQLLMVESIFRATKTLLETRPVYHKCDETIRGHIWCSFLALLLRKELMDSMEATRSVTDERLEWGEMLDDLEMLTEYEIEVGDKRYALRSESKPGAVKAFAACGLRLPPQMRQL